MPLIQKIFGMARARAFEFILLACLGLAVLVRYQLFNFVSGDYRAFFSSWYDEFAQRGIGALSKNASNYPPIYQLWLYVASNPLSFLPKNASLKLLPVFFDFVAAGFVYLIVRLKYQKSIVPFLACLCALFAPTLILNGAAWAQIDSIHTAFLLGCIYFFLRQKTGWAAVCFGLAFAFKFQAIFLAPFLIILFFKGKFPLKSALLIPAVWLFSLLPGILAGRSLVSLLSLYGEQANQFPVLAANFPSLYSVIPVNYFRDLNQASLVFAAGVILIFIVFVAVSKEPLTNEKIIFLSAFCLIFVPFVMPRMHDRYMLPADIAAILCVFYLPRLLYLPVVVQAASLNSYIFYLIGVYAAPQIFFAGVLLVLLVVLTYKLLKDFYPSLNLAQG